MKKRKLIKKYAPAAQSGFLGAGHIARALIQGDFRDTDPFILMMDDTLDKKTDEPSGGPHPHAGFETVTLVLEGEIGDETHKMKVGDLQLMTAGSGIIHTESITKKIKLRILQLWLTLPKTHRWTLPRVQDISYRDVPGISSDGTYIKLYSGSLEGISSPVKNHTPLLIADVQMRKQTTKTLGLPASFTAFLYVIEGTVLIGEDKSPLTVGQVGWLDRSGPDAESEIELATIGESTRFVLYAGEPQGDKIVSHGPFIGDSNEDIIRLYQKYRDGKMKHISTVDDLQKINWSAPVGNMTV